MHLQGLGRLAIILLGAVVLLGALPGSAEDGEESLAAVREVGTKDLGERGELVIPSLDLSDAELPVVLRAIAKFSGLNIIASEDVRGKVSLFWENVTVRNALDAILTTNDYSYIRRGNVVYVLPEAKLGEDRVKTVTRVYFLQYLDAAEVEESLREVFGSQGSGGGGGSSGAGKTISSNVSSNSILITDTPEQVDKIVALLEEIDRPFKQVRIETRLIEMRYNVGQQLGIDWTYFEQGSPQNQLDINTAPFDFATGLTQAAGMFQFGLIRDGGKTLSGYIQAHNKSNNVRVLANPAVTVLHNTKALIEITNDIPYVEANISQGVITESVSFKTTGITLEVTPRINDEGDIIMWVKPTQQIAGPRVILQNSNAFPVDKRSVQTELRVPDNTTIVIGGLRSSETENTRVKVPMLGDIPFLGALFTRKEDSVVETDLLLFVTPRIVSDYLLSDKEVKDYNEFDNIGENLKKVIEEREKKEREQEERRLSREARNALLEQRRQEWNERRGGASAGSVDFEIEEESLSPTSSSSSSSPQPAPITASRFDWEGDWALEEGSNEIIVRGDSMLSAPSAAGR
ncbi:MAG TPA: hypothetical protein ENN74_00395 [Firmicutes bacterium]|nr:hypothetical protein [Bacillota bacterium]